MESIRGKGYAYVKTMPRHRILNTLVNYDIAVLMFIGLNIILGREMSVRQMLLSLACWDSVGNSNWYVFIIILCYAIAWGSSIVFKGEGRVCYAVLVLCALSMFSLSFIRPSWWYDTILCFPVGMIYSKWKHEIERLCVKHYWPLMSMLCAAAILLGIKCPGLLGVGWNIKAIVFVLAIILFTMNFPIRHIALQWLGQHLFPLYIYQRMPMMVLFYFDPVGFATWRMPLYFALSLVITFVISALYKKWQIML